MPELPEVQTTVQGLNTYVKNLVIKDVWTDYKSSYHKGKDNIKNPHFFEVFKKNILNQKIIGAQRRAKNILIFLKNDFVMIVHMKMTGHFLYGKYTHTKKGWVPDNTKSDLANPKSRFIHLVLTFSNKNHLAFSDMRKFAKITLVHKKDLTTTLHLKSLGLEPLKKTFTLKTCKQILLKKPKTKIKQALLMPELISGIGNIYSDEILFRASIHPERKIESLNNKELQLLFKAIKQTLKKGIDFGGDSTSDYRNILGRPGSFQESHQAYRRTNEGCNKQGCKGKIIRKKIGGRSAHFCDTHQI